VSGSDLGWDLWEVCVRFGSPEGVCPVRTSFDEAIACFERAIELQVEDLANALRYAAEAAFEMHKTTPDQRLARKDKDYAKRALHLGRPEAHDRWIAG
jgi:hypothetical protein